MSMTPLTVAGIKSAIITDVESRIGGTIPVIAIAFVRVLATALAAVIVLLYKYTSTIYLDMFVATASDKPTTIGGQLITPLTEWGRLVGAGDPVAAVAAELTTTVTVTNQTGLAITAGTSLVHDPSGVVYITQADVLRDAATVVLTVTAASDQSGGGGLGAIGNRQNGDILTFTSPLADVVQDTTVASTVVSGEDPEPSAQYRQRVIDRFQKRPQGGALADYEVWGEEAAGIVNIYPYTGDPGRVELFCEADPVSSGSPDGIPTQAQLDAVAALVELDENSVATRRPANALVFTFPITRKAFTVDVLALSAPDLTATKQAIEDGLDTQFATFEPFIGGLTVTPRDRITTTKVGKVVDDIVEANGGTFSSVLLKTQVVQQSTFLAAIITSTDDASETGGAMTLTGAVLAFVSTNTIGFRFQNVNVPVGATVVSATLTFTSPSVKNPYSVLTVRGLADTDPGTFTAAVNDITDRNTTTASTALIADAWGVDDAKPVDIKEIVQEIIDTGGWAALNAMGFTVTSATGSDREARSYDDDPAKAAAISITYTAETAGFASASVTTLVKGQKAKVTTVSFP